MLDTDRLLDTPISFGATNEDVGRPTSNDAIALGSKLLEWSARRLRKEQDVPILEAHDEMIKVIRYGCLATRGSYTWWLRRRKDEVGREEKDS